MYINIIIYGNKLSLFVLSTLKKEKKKKVKNKDTRTTSLTTSHFALMFLLFKFKQVNTRCVRG